MEFTKEDVEHIDVLIADALYNNPKLISLPGAEHARNKIARRVGMPEAELGEITCNWVARTYYGSVRVPPTSDYGTRDD